MSQNSLEDFQEICNGENYPDCNCKQCKHYKQNIRPLVLRQNDIILFMYNGGIEDIFVEEYEQFIEDYEWKIKNLKKEYKEHVKYNNRGKKQIQELGKYKFMELK